jgi:hypothetical protein
MNSKLVPLQNYFLVQGRCPMYKVTAQAPFSTYLVDNFDVVLYNLLYPLCSSAFSNIT